MKARGLGGHLGHLGHLVGMLHIGAPGLTVPVAISGTGGALYTSRNSFRGTDIAVHRAAVIKPQFTGTLPPDAAPSRSMEITISVTIIVLSRNTLAQIHAEPMPEMHRLHIAPMHQRVGCDRAVM